MATIEALTHDIAKAAQAFVAEFQEVARWQLRGPWYEVAMKISGSIGILALLRVFLNLFIRGADADERLFPRILFFLWCTVALAWVALLVVGVWLTFLQ